MKRLQHLLALLILALAAPAPVRAFSLLGPLLPWQLATYANYNIGYNFLGDIGGPQTPLEFYRWNVPVVTYAFDESFIRYFGTNGMREVERAFAILNAIPPASTITNDGSRLFINGEPVPFDTKRINHEARAAGLFDLMSWSLGSILEEIGLAEPERWAHTLRGRAVLGPNNTITNWSTIVMNYDPITLQPTNKINGVTYTYEIFEQENPNVAEAVDFAIDSNAILPFSSVAGRLFGVGEFYTGLTHDDVGGIRFLLDPNNLVTESFLPGVQPFNFVTSPWYPVFVGTNAGATNVVGTNTSLVVTQALHGGVNKIRYERVNFDSLLGQTFTPITNKYTDVFINPTNGRTFKVKMERAITTPDMIFAVGDLGITLAGEPFLFRRTSTDSWINNDLLNGFPTTAESGGPGIITGPVIFEYTDKLPYFSNGEGGFIFGPFASLFFLGSTGSSTASPRTEFGALRSAAWASFDGTTNSVVIYPKFRNLNLQDIRNEILSVRGPR